jgi:hypothetical protein
MQPLLAVVHGALVMATFVAGLFFLRFWRETRDRLFAMFALAFWVLGVNWLGIAVLATSEEARMGFCLLRLAAFVLILVAIVDKNRHRPDAGRRDRGPGSLPT